uniref:Uncharacterized protein MANES_04G013400 n=1 Tax=Rhizophora mucronata TaxID=61149 RepID=A0A2P2KM42_RHIMU
MQINEDNKHTRIGFLEEFGTFENVFISISR